MLYKITNKKLDSIIDEWLTEWKVPVDIDELSDTEQDHHPLV